MAKTSSSVSKQIEYFSLMLLISVILLALIMRTPMTSLTPLTKLIQSDYGLSASFIGSITTIPLIIFALSSQPISYLSRYISSKVMLVIASFILVFAILLRSIASVGALLIGTIFIGLGISIINTLLPVLIKEDAPLKIGMFTAIYTSVMEAGSVVASACSYPVAEVLGWRGSLSLWSIIPALAGLSCFLLWRASLKQESSQTKNYHARFKISLSKAKWLIFYMALQSLLFYTLVAWLPSLMIDKGLSLEGAGYMAAFFQLLNIPGSFIAPILAQKMKEQSALGAITGLLYILGFLIILLSNNIALLYLGTALCALSAGASIALALALIGIQAQNSESSKQLSGVVQSFGYGFAAIGPFLIGFFLDIQPSWNIPLIFLIGIAIFQTMSGFKAGKQGYIA